MPVQEIQITENWLVTVIGWLWTGLLSVLAWIGYQQYKRLGDIELALSKKADKEYVEVTYQEFKDELKEHRKESREDFIILHNSIIDEVKNYLLTYKK